MTANQRLVIESFERNAKSASTEALRQHAAEQLAAFRERMGLRHRQDRPNPFSRFIEMLEKSSSSNLRNLD